MNVLLVRLPYSHVYKVFPKAPKRREIRPHMGLLCIANYLQRAGHEVNILDGEVSGLSLPEIARQASHYDVLGITATTPEFNTALAVCRMTKQYNKKTITILGGAHVSALPYEAYDESREWVDYMVVGEGEIAMTNILYSIEVGHPLFHIVYGEEADLNISRPARHLLDYRHYAFAAPGRGLIPMDVIESSRGCPFSCSFCFNSKKATRYKDPGLVAKEIRESVELRGTKLFMFLDDTLTLSYKHIYNVCEAIKKLNLPDDVGFYGNARANRAEPFILRAMKEAGFVELSLGIESGNQEILDGVGKGATLDEYREAYANMDELGFQTRGSFILGLPGETHQTVRDSIDFAKELPLKRVSCNILMPYPGTELLERAQDGDGLLLVNENWSDFTRWGDCVARTDELTCEELIAYQKEFLREFYLQYDVIKYHWDQFLAGNRSKYYYRPMIFAIKEEIRAYIYG